MNKLGFYVENTTVQYLRDALRKVLPPTVLIHAVDRGLLREIRAGLSPNTFMIGRLFVDQSQQTAWLDSGDPAAAGRAFAEQIINYDFSLAKERGQNGRLLIDAWMSLNEPVRGPASFPDGKPDAETRRRLDALDKFQEAFYLRLRADGLEAVAFNFAAGNFTEGSHYLDYFPRTLVLYKYLGFHEYGWPRLEPRSDTATAALLYRRAMTEIRKKYGDRHQVIITELGLARMYKYPSDPAGDVGWLYPGETISEDQYWTSLELYNSELLRDSYVMGCALFNVGPTGRWETFRHLGVNNQGQPILLMDKIATLNKPEPDVKPPVAPDLAALQQRVELVQSNLDLIITNCDTVLRQLAALEVTLQSLAAAIAVAPTPEETQSLIRRLETVKSTLGLLDQAGVTGIDIPALQALADNLLTQAWALQAPVQQAEQLRQDISQAQETLHVLANQTQTVVTLKQHAQVLRVEADKLAAQLGVPPPTQPVPQPVMQDKRTTLATKPGASYPTRPLTAIKRVIIHHTVTRDDVTPERLAQAQVAQGKPGITYHFLVNGDGAITWTQPAETAVEQTLVPDVNADGIAVALAGNFQQAVPTPAQMESAAMLVAWLLSSLGLIESAVYGRSELDKRVGSPGAQWAQGSRYKDTLLTRVKSILAGRK
jgi:hypothetical protein